LDRVKRQDTNLAGKGVPAHKTVVNVSRERSILSSVASVLLYPNRPELVGCEIADLLAVAGCVESVRVISRASDGTVSTVGGAGSDPSNLTENEQRLHIGRTLNGEVEILLKPKADIGATVAIGAVALLVSV